MNKNCEYGYFRNTEYGAYEYLIIEMTDGAYELSIRKKHYCDWKFVIGTFKTDVLKYMILHNDEGMMRDVIEEYENYIDEQEMI